MNYPDSNGYNRVQPRVFREMDVLLLGVGCALLLILIYIGTTRWHFSMRQIQEIAVQQLPYFWLVETLSTRAWPARCAGFKPWTGLFAEAAYCKK